MTRVQSRSAIVLLLAVTLVGVQGRPYPNDFTFTDQPQYPYFRRPVPESTGGFDSQPDESSQRWASTQNAGVTPGFHYETAETKAAGDKFWTPELLARIKAYNAAQDAKYDYTREAQRFEAPVKTATASESNEFPKMLEDGTELLWVSEPHTTTPHEMAQLARLMENSSATKPTTPATTTEATSRPEVNRNEVKGSTEDANVFDVDTSAWEAGPWGTKHRPGAEHSLTYVGYGGVNDAHVASTDASPDHNSP